MKNSPRADTPDRGLIAISAFAVVAVAFGERIGTLICARMQKVDEENSFDESRSAVSLDKENTKKNSINQEINISDKH